MFKSYIVLLTCASACGIHLEFMTDMEPVLEVKL